MNQASLAKHLGKPAASIVNKAKKYAFKEGREFSYENKGEKGKERKIFSLAGIRRLEKGFEIPKDKWYRPQGGDDGYWVVDQLPPNKSIVYLKHSQTEERATMHVQPKRQRTFVKGRRIWEKAFEDVTPKRTLAGSIWTGLPRPPERKFRHKKQYPKNRGYYREQAADGTMV